MTALDNIFWRALSGPHVGYSVGTDAARRYARGFSPIAAFPRPDSPSFDALAPFCEVAEQLYCGSWSGSPPAGWRIEREVAVQRMVWQGGDLPGDQAPDAAVLGPEHAGQALALAALTQPGPFGPRTIELGDYFGYFDGPRLVAMAGERAYAGVFREISGVCTHPEYQGRGLARRLTTRLMHRQVQRGETPFLHVLPTNVGAVALYERLGFRADGESVARIVSRR